MKQMIMRTVGALALSLTLVSPLAAQHQSCVDTWIAYCDAALAEANYLEKVAIGIFCTGMLATCPVQSITVKLL